MSRLITGPASAQAQGPRSARPPAHGLARAPGSQPAPSPAPVPAACARPPSGASGPAASLSSAQAIFEILTSEFSYQHSLGILVSEFLQCAELQATMTQTERHHLFSNIQDVRGASQK